MADIFHDFTVKAPRQEVFRAVTSPAGLDTWWTKSSDGKPEEGAQYQLGFGPGYDWGAVVSRCIPDSEFELRFTSALPDWMDTRVGFSLEENDGVTNAHFHHTGWPESNEHYQVSCYCWAMYLRLLKRYVERGEVVPYEDRLEA